MIARINRALSAKDRDKGFTLIELLVVIIIIGILAAIAVPQFIKQREKGFDAQVKSDLKNAALVAETNYTDLLSYSDANVFKQGAVAAGKEIASPGASYRAFVDSDEYVIYGLSKSGRVFVLDSRTTGTPEVVSGASALPAAATPALTGGGALASPINWPAAPVTP